MGSTFRGQAHISNTTYTPIDSISQQFHLVSVGAKNFWVKAEVSETGNNISDFRAMNEVLFVTGVYAYRYSADKQLILICRNWKEITNLKDIPDTRNVYLLMDPNHESANVFGHWIAEALIFLPTIAKLLLALPNLKVVLSGYQRFKIKILQHYRIPFVVLDGEFMECKNLDGGAENDFLYQFKSTDEINYFGIMPLITSEHTTEYMPYFSELAKKFYYFIDNNLPPNPFKNIDISYFPRHKEGNHPAHDRTYKDDDIKGYLSTRSNCVIAESQILNWEEEIDILSRSKIIIVPDGSALAATFYARNSTIIVLGSVFALTAFRLRQKSKIQLELLEKTNRVYFIGKNRNENFLKDCLPLIDYSIVVA